MSNYLGDYAVGSTIYFNFDTYDSNGASVTLTGLAVTDIEIYKNGSTTQRASDSGYTLLDTDGIDVDGITGFHGFSIDLSDNTTAGFFVAGADYTVLVSSVTVDSQTVNFSWQFSIENRFQPGLLVATTIATLASQTSFTLTAGSANDDAYNNHMAIISDVASGVQKCVGIVSDYTGSTKTVTLGADPGIFTVTAGDNIRIVAVPPIIPTVTSVTNQVTADVTAISGDSGAADNLESYTDGTTPMPVNATQISGDSTAADNAELFFDGTGYNASNSAIGTVAEVTTVNGLAADTVNASALAADAVAEINATVDTALTDYDAPTYTELLNLFRVALRSDSALATDLSALITSINADLSSGAGDYANTTDAQEAIRDKQTDIETDTQDLQTQVGTAGAGLTAIPWNGDWDTEVQSEVQGAIEANHLDHLLAVTYDPASKPGAADALLNELVENDGGVARFSANALEQSPAGSAPTAGEIADAVWTEAIADHSGTTGSTAEALAGASAPSAASVADAVWDEALSGHVTAGTAGERLGRVPNADAGGNGGLPTVDANNRIAGIQGTITTLDALDTAQDTQHSTTRSDIATVDSSVDAILVDTGTTIPGILGTPADTDLATDIANLNDISAADVNAQVLDVLNTDTFAEPTGVPPATATLATKIGYQYMALRNKVTVTASKKTFYDDADNAEWEKDLTDDGTTYTESEGNAP